MQIKSLSSTVASLQQILQQNASKGVQAKGIEDAAAQANFPDPELAAEVYKHLQKQKVNVEALSQQDVSDAFMSLMLKDKGQKLAQPWVLARQEIRQSSAVVGKAFEDLAAATEQKGFGYKPDLQGIAEDLNQTQGPEHQAGKVLMQALQNANPEVQNADLNTLVDFLSDKQNIQNLKKSNPEISWKSYAAQAGNLLAHQQVGQALKDVEEATGQ